MSKIRNLTCIVCPRGCPMVITLSDEGVVEKVEGNFCKRGVGYANDECTNPKRTVTSTVRVEDDSIISVKTDRTVPKSLMFQVMEEINKATASCGTKIGDIIIENLCGTGANLVATSNHK